MIKIDLLKNYPQYIPALGKIWYDVLGKIWMPEITLKEIEDGYYEELNNSQNIPITYIALYNEIPVGSCTIELDGGIKPGIGPWIGDLVVKLEHQKQGIGQMLLSIATKRAKELDYTKLYLFTFNISEYYERFGWKKVAIDNFKSHPIIIMEMEL